MIEDSADTVRQYGQLLYGIKPFHADDAANDEDSEGAEDIQASI